MVWTTATQDCEEVIDILLKELKTTFLWHETISHFHTETFRKRAAYVIEGISETALRTNVLLTLSGKGKDEKSNKFNRNFITVLVKLARLLLIMWKYTVSQIH